MGLAEVFVAFLAAAFFGAFVVFTAFVAEAFLDFAAVLDFGAVFGFVADSMPFTASSVTILKILYIEDAH